MKKLLVLLFLITIHCNIFAQNTANAQESIVFSPEQNAVCLTCGEGNDVVAYVAKYITYPKISRENGIQGKVYIKFLVEKDGTISNLAIVRIKTNKDEAIVQIKNRKKDKDKIDADVKTIEDAEKALADETTRVTALLSKWQPAMDKGKAVRTSFTYPLTFKLE